jgi:hypothetical protein
MISHLQSGQGIPCAVGSSITSFLLPLVRVGGGLISAEPAAGRTAVARRLGAGLIMLCAVLPDTGGAVWGVAGSRLPMRWREGVLSRVPGPADGGSSARGSSSSDTWLPAQACRKVQHMLFDPAPCA